MDKCKEDDRVMRETKEVRPEEVVLYCSVCGKRLGRQIGLSGYDRYTGNPTTYGYWTCPTKGHNHIWDSSIESLLSERPGETCAYKIIAGDKLTDGKN